MTNIEKERAHHSEKNRVAMTSVAAAVFLTVSKSIIGLLTGSLGILSEALHSGLDLIAAIMTLLAVRSSASPPDSDHHYGHGKVENLSALGETILLLITCGWIVNEACSRLLGGRTMIEVNVWSFIVVVTSVVIDFSRSRALSRVAKKTGSQALEADALHFSTDIWSSSVVLLGLACAKLGYNTADPIAALIVAVIVVSVSFRLGKRSIDVLLDRAPLSMRESVRAKALEVSGVRAVHDIKVRTAGAETFVEVSIHLDRTLTLESAHELAHAVARKVESLGRHWSVLVHTEPHTANHT